MRPVNVPEPGFLEHCWSRMIASCCEWLLIWAATGCQPAKVIRRRFKEDENIENDPSDAIALAGRSALSSGLARIAGKDWARVWLLVLHCFAGVLCHRASDENLSWRCLAGGFDGKWPPGSRPRKVSQIVSERRRAGSLAKNKRTPPVQVNCYPFHSRVPSDYFIFRKRLSDGTPVLVFAFDFFFFGNCATRVMIASAGCHIGCDSTVIRRRHRA